MLTKPGDIVLTRGTSILSQLIRLASRGLRGFGLEQRTKANHVGLVVRGASTFQQAVIVEALHTVKRHALGVQYGGRQTEVAIYRPINLTPMQVNRVVEEAERYVGRRYGYLKIAAHALDTVLLGAYAFRRLARMDRYPICSWLVAYAYERGAGKDFGVPPYTAQPDDISDFCEAHPEAYNLVRGWRVLA